MPSRAPVSEEAVSVLSSSDLSMAATEPRGAVQLGLSESEAIVARLLLEDLGCRAVMCLGR